MPSPNLGRVIRSVRAEVDGFFEEWIGFALPPVHQAVAEAGWTAEKPGSYCPRCGQSTGPGELSSSGCGNCRGSTLRVDGVVRLGRYSEDLRQWILRIKYGRWSEMASYLGRTLGDAVRRANLVELDRTIVVPMAMPWLRRAYRGIDHARELADAVAKELNVPAVRILSKANGPTQLGVPKSSRAVNARRGMGVRRRWGGWSLDGLDCVVVDDVRTSGASMEAAARLLRPLGARRVIGAVVAVAESGRRNVKGQTDEAEQMSA